MRKHSYGNKPCTRCNKIHTHPKGMLGKSNKGVHLGFTPWNKGLTSKTDPRVAKYGSTNSKNWHNSRTYEYKQKFIKQGIYSLKKYINSNPDHQRYAGFCASLKRPIHSAWNFTSKPQQKLFDIVKKSYPDAIMNHKVVYMEDGIKKVFYLDIVIPSLNTDIEYDGSYWHQNKEKDQKRDKILKEQDWKIIRIDEEKLSLIEKNGLKCVSL